MRTIDLCRPCAEARKAAGQRLRPAITGVDRKIRCADCGRRRFGEGYFLQDGEDGLPRRAEGPPRNDGGKR